MYNSQNMSRALLVSVLLLSASLVHAQTATRARTPPVIDGIYETIPDSETLPGGLKNTGGMKDVQLLPATIDKAKTADLKEDPGKNCLPVGPFRFMARSGVKFEFVSAPGVLFMFFEDVSHGHKRNIHLTAKHPAKVSPSWMGDSIGTWEQGTFVIDTVGFMERIWLNDAGAPHSGALHLVERIRPIMNGNVLEYKMTADDPAALAKPYTYTRYFKKTQVEIGEDFCEVELD